MKHIKTKQQNSNDNKRKPIPNKQHKTQYKQTT